MTSRAVSVAQRRVLLLKPGPIFEAVESIWPERVGRRKRLWHGCLAQGRKFDQAMARELGGFDELLLICGRYEGVDEACRGALGRLRGFGRRLRAERR